MSARPEGTRGTPAIEPREVQWPWSHLAPQLSERRLLLVTVDLLVLNSILAGRLVVAQQLELTPANLWASLGWFVALSLLWYTVAAALEAYELTVAAAPFKSVFHVVQAYLLIAPVYLLIPQITTPLFEYRLVWLGQAALSLTALAAWRLSYARLIVQPSFRRRAVIVGAGSAGQMAAELLRRHVRVNYQIVGFVDDDPARQGASFEGIGVLGISERLPAVAAAAGATDIVLAITPTIRPKLFATLLSCQEQGYTIYPLPVLYEELAGRVPLAYLDHDWWTLWQHRHSPFRKIYRGFKRLMDVVLALTALGALVLPGLVIALAIRLDSPGPVFYRQVRIGQGGRPITVTKFRTMIAGAEADGQPRWTQTGDERITRVGRWLRRARLDEWPQFLNLLDGSMTLIGPRPERPAFVEQLAAEIPFYRARHLVRPGLTGWAQVQYQYGQSVDDARVKLEYDLYYMKHEGPYLDLLVLLRTIRAVLRLEGQ